MEFKISHNSPYKELKIKGDSFTTEEMGSEFYSIMRNLSKLNIVGETAKTQIEENSKMLSVVKEGLSEDEYEM